MTCCICGVSFERLSSRDEPGHDCACGRNFSRRDWRESDVTTKEVQKSRVQWQLFVENKGPDPRLVEA